MLRLILIALVVILPLILLAWRLRRSQPDMESGGSDGRQILNR